MIKNGKFFQPPPNDNSDFKELFRRIAAAGVGRPIGSDGFPEGPWTPELLAEAITVLSSNKTGVDVRTVQLWFQVNDKGISSANLRWLARVFGCGDPVATSEWQVALSAAHSRLSSKRKRPSKSDVDHTQAAVKQKKTNSTDVCVADESEVALVNFKPHSSLVRRSEAMFSGESTLNLPTYVFAGMSALGFLSYIIGIHNVSFFRSNGVVKQVGFLWAANWTLVFMVFLPLFLLFASELVYRWKNERRLSVQAENVEMNNHSWQCVMDGMSYSFWTVFIICVLFAGVLQWIGVCLIPVLNGGSKFAVDWSTITIIQPETISAPVQLIFTSLAYLYMCFSFYSFFVGLILIYAVINDYSKICETMNGRNSVTAPVVKSESASWILKWVFRCAVLGIMIAIFMKLQSSYLASNGTNVVVWILSDLSSLFDGPIEAKSRISYRMPTHYSSLLVAVSTCFVFIYGLVRTGDGLLAKAAVWKMSGTMMLLCVSYAFIDAFNGFSILVLLGITVAIYGLIDPTYGSDCSREVRSSSVF